MQNTEINMKSKIKKNHPLGACGTDTNPRRLYEVTVYREDYFSTKYRVEAASEREAESKAEQFAKGGKLPQWDFIVSEVYHAECVQPKNGGRSHE